MDNRNVPKISKMLDFIKSYKENIIAFEMLSSNDALNTEKTLYKLIPYGNFLWVGKDKSKIYICCSKKDWKRRLKDNFQMTIIPAKEFYDISDDCKYICLSIDELYLLRDILLNKKNTREREKEIRLDLLERLEEAINKNLKKQ